MVVQSWDTASKVTGSTDYSVCTTWGVDDAQRIYLLNVWRGKLNYPDLRRKIRKLAREFGATNVLIEDTASGIQLIQELAGEHFARIEGVKPKGPKEFRMRNQTAAIEAGRVLVPREAHWLAGYFHELELFPNGRHDDQVDSTSQALEWIAMSSGPARWLQMMDKVFQGRDAGSEAEAASRTVSFRHSDPGIEFKVSSGRWVVRSADGLFYVTPAEWQGLMSTHGITLVDHPGHDTG
jgi:predicted phage terminase large subunit-like protein